MSGEEFWKLFDRAEIEISNIIGATSNDYYIDDTKWGEETGTIYFGIYHASGVQVDEFNFRYRPELEPLTAEEQLEDAIDRFDGRW